MVGFDQVHGSPAARLDVYGVECVEDLNMLEDEHISELCKLLKMIPAKKFREKIAAECSNSLSSSTSTPIPSSPRRSPRLSVNADSRLLLPAFVLC